MQNLKKKNVSKIDASPLIEESLDIPRILSKHLKIGTEASLLVVCWVMVMPLSFAIQRGSTSFLLCDDEVVVVASETCNSNSL